MMYTATITTFGDSDEGCAVFVTDGGVNAAMFDFGSDPLFAEAFAHQVNHGTLDRALELVVGVHAYVNEDLPPRGATEVFEELMDAAEVD